MSVDRTGASERNAAMTRTWPQRLLISAATLAAVVSLVMAGVVWFTQQRLEERQLVPLEEAGVVVDGQPGAVDVGVSDDGDFAGGPLTSNPNTPPETFPPAEPGAQNILITGADNNACLDPDSRFAPAFGDRSDLVERSDTIMMWRVNPDTSQVAVLSFPRDLWLQIDGRSSKGRINEAYQRDDPQRLINTIRNNFGIETNHFVQVDFCAFKELVDSVGGVAVPFETPVRDGSTGLIVTEPGCFTFSGEHALAYVRSRHLEYQNDDGIWKDDVSSDLGRISRQQDFIRRVGDELLSNAFSPSVVRSLVDVSRNYILTDEGLTIDRILSLSGILQNSDPANITTYQIEAQNETIQGNAVLDPLLGGDNMQAVLALFRGEITLANRPDQNLDSIAETTVPPTTVPVVDPDLVTTGASVPGTDAPDATTADSAPADTVPGVTVDDIVYGVRPNSNISCTG